MTPLETYLNKQIADCVDIREDAVTQGNALEALLYTFKMEAYKNVRMFVRDELYPQQAGSPDAQPSQQKP